MLSRQNTEPRYLEIDDIRRSQDRRWWFVTSGSIAVAAICALAAYGSSSRSPGVVIYDRNGHPRLFDDVDAPRWHMDDMRIEYFTELFIRRFVGIDSANLQIDLTEALNMMTPRLRKVTITEGAVAKNRSLWQDRNVRTRFDSEAMEVRIGRYDPTDQAARIPVLVTGQKIYGAKFGALPKGETEPVEWFCARIELERVKVTKDAIFGLAVNSITVNPFDSREGLENFFRSKES